MAELLAVRTAGHRVHAGHREEVFRESPAGVVIEVVVGFGTCGSDALLVDERVDQDGVALVGFRTVWEALSAFASKRLGLFRIGLHQGANLLHQRWFIGVFRPGGGRRVSVWWRRCNARWWNGCRCWRAAGGLSDLRWFVTLGVSPVENCTDGDGGEEERDVEGTAHVQITVMGDPLDPWA